MDIPTIVSTHPFEQAGLGKAPFQLVGMTEKVFKTPGGSKPGGTCDYCSTGILYCFAILSSDGKEFVVGSDCIKKTSRASLLLTAVEDKLRKLNKQKRQQKTREYHERIGAQYRAIFDDAEIVARLNSLPHPKLEGLTLFDYVEWMWRNAGDAGRTRVLDMVKTAADKENKI